MVQLYAFAGETVLVDSHVRFVVERSELGGSVSVLLIVARDATVWWTNALTCD